MAKTGQPLTRQKVLEAALQLIDRDGLEGLSMRKLGATLGVEAMSLYNHVDSKRDVFDGVIELLLGQTPYPEIPDATPREELWAVAHAFRAALRAHPRVLPLVATTPLRTEASLDILDHLLAIFHRANIRGVTAIYALQCLMGSIVGHTLLEMGTTSVTGVEPGPNGPTVWQQFPQARYPTLHMVLPDLVQWNAEHEFDFGLQALFDGLFER